MTKRKDPSELKTPGRKSGYNPGYHPKLIYYMSVCGKTNEEMAAEIGIAESTLYNWFKVYPELLEAIKGKDAANSEVTKSLFQRANGYTYDEIKVTTVQVKSNENGNIITLPGTKIEKTTKHVPGDVAAAIFWLKNRDPENWRDVYKHFVKNMELNDLEEDAIDAELAKLLAIESAGGVVADAQKEIIDKINQIAQSQNSGLAH